MNSAGDADSRGSAATGISEKSAWALLRPLFSDRLPSLATLTVASILAGLTESGILALLAQVAAALVNRTSRIHVKIAMVHATTTVDVLLLAVIALGLLRIGLQVLVSVPPARIVANTQVRLRYDLFSAFTRASWSVQSRDREGQLQELLSDQASAAAGGAIQATMLITMLIMFLALVASALALNPLAALTVVGMAAGLFLVLRPVSELGRRHADTGSLAAIDYASGIGEAVRLAEETRVYGVADVQRERIHQLATNIEHPVFYTQFLLRLIPGVYQSLIYVFVAAGLAILYATGAGNLASLGAVMLLLVRAGSYGQQAQGAYQGLRQTLPYIVRVEEAQRRYGGSVPRAGRQSLAAISSLRFEDVSYSYEGGRAALSDVSFEVDVPDSVGIVGPSGAGKSTLVQVLLRLRAPDSGQYLVNGSGADGFAPEDWQNRVAYVPQEPRLLHASVADNIRFFRDFDHNAIQRAAELAGIHDEITKWSAGYETLVGPRADAVSGGQQQRLCLARALVGRPQILVLDEPTSALDPHSEFLIQNSLAMLRNELTLFVVAHRMSTLDVCRRVMVVVDGRLEAFDTVDRLQGNNAYYRSSLSLAGSSPKAIT